jgi:hypothetical protein
MSIYLEYKKTEKEVLESKNSQAISYFLINYIKIIDRQIQSFKYTYGDVTKEEWKILYALNNWCEDDIIQGDKLLKICGDIKTKKLIYTQSETIDAIYLLSQIQELKENQDYKKYCQFKINL